MLHSKYHKKETKEDPKTSAIFENLMLLPDNVFWHLIRSSCFDGYELPSFSGKLLDYAFWPHWDKSGTPNERFVEPDLFLQFEMFDVVIEVKYGDSKGQYKEQWEKEIIAYYNEYTYDKPLVFIAVGGNETTKKEHISIKGSNMPIFKCNWLSLLISVNKYNKELENVTVPDYNVYATQRLLKNIVLAFNLNNIYNIIWFNSIAEPHTTISPSSIENFSNFFKL